MFYDLYHKKEKGDYIQVPVRISSSNFDTRFSLPVLLSRVDTMWCKFYLQIYIFLIFIFRLQNRMQNFQEYRRRYWWYDFLASSSCSIRWHRFGATWSLLQVSFNKINIHFLLVIEFLMSV